MNYKEEMELMHFGKLGMRWGKRSAVPNEAKQINRANKATAKADKEFAKPKNVRKIANAALSKLNNDPEYTKAATDIAAKLVKDGLAGRVLQSEYNRQMIEPMNKALQKNPATYNASKTAFVGMVGLTNQTTGETFLAPALLQNEVKQSENDDNSLTHFGVMGMRWGQRRAQNGAAAVRKVGGAYANSMAKKQERIKKESAGRIKAAKSGEKTIRKATKAYANAMDKKAERLGKEIDAKTKAKADAKIKKLDAKSKNNPSWLKKQAGEWKKAWKEAQDELAAEEANKDWGDHVVDSVRSYRRRKAIDEAWEAGKAAARNRNAG